MKSENWILVILQKQLGKGFYKQANIDCVLFICSPCKKFLSDRNKKEDNWKFTSEMKHC